MIFFSPATPPYISPLQCPFPEVQTNDCPPCLKNNLCCNSECTRAVLPPKPCFALLAQLPPPMPGSYVPQCTPDGNFAPIQFWGSTGYSWCVNVATGKPLSESVRPGQQLNCSGTMWRGALMCLVWCAHKRLYMYVWGCIYG